MMNLSYSKFKRIFGDLGIGEWVKFNWLSNAGIARSIYNKVVESGYNPLAYVNNELYNRITKSINIWDEEWEVVGEGQSKRIVTKNFNKCFPNTKYYIQGPINIKPQLFGYGFKWYDKNFNLINTLYYNYGAVTSPDNAYYFKFGLSEKYGIVYNHDICINLSNPYINGQYFPYFEGEKFLVLVGSVDLGTLNFTRNQYQDKYYYFRAVLSAAKPGIPQVLSNYLCAKYTTVTAGTVNLKNDLTIANFPGTALVLIRDDSYTDAATFKQAMSGVPLDYELATPVLIDL